MKTITLSGVIGWDIYPADLRQALADARGDDVEIIISSPGGYVSDGLEMFNLIRNYPGQTTARLSGYAMSMASYIPLAANRIVAEDNAVYMIHNVRGGVWGDHNDILQYGETTKGLSLLIARAYAKATGKPLEEVTAMMDKETYFFGQDMVDAGFVHEIIATIEPPDQTTALALARNAFGECVARMSADVSAAKTDLIKAAALSSGHLTGAAPLDTKPKGATIMTLDKLRADHPDLVAALAVEATKGMISSDEAATLAAAARTEGAEAERQRMLDVKAQAIPGHEALIEQMVFDGKSTGADAALAIVAAEKTARDAAARTIEQDANGAVQPSGDEGQEQKTMKRADFNALSLQDQRAAIASGVKVIQ